MAPIGECIRYFVVWPHAPTHYLSAKGAYIVTAGTYRHAPFFAGRQRLLQDALIRLALELDWRLEASAVFANHYHFVAQSPGDPESLRSFVRRLHAGSATAINRAHASPGRKVWINYWESLIVDQRSYYARLAYVHQNAVKHGIVPIAAAYEWCSASWFEASSERPLVETVYSFKTDDLRTVDVDCD